MTDRTARANGALIKQLCNAKKPRLTQQELATKSGWHLRVITKLVAGKRVQERVIEDVADVLGTTYANLTAGCNPSSDIVPVTPEIHQQIISVIEESGAGTKIRKILGSDKMVIAVFASGVGSLLLACTGLFPLYAPPFYVIGIVASGLGLGLAWSRGHGYILPAAGMAACVTAMTAWPNVVGLFPTANGYQLRSGVRMQWVNPGDPRYFGQLKVDLHGLQNIYAFEPVIYKIQAPDGTIFTDGFFQSTMIPPYPLYDYAIGSECEVTLEVAGRPVDHTTVRIRPGKEPSICSLTVPAHPPSKSAFFMIWAGATGYDVYVDGVKVGKSTWPKSVFETTPGTHEFAVEIDGQRYAARKKILAVNDKSNAPGDFNIVTLPKPGSTN